MSLSDLLQWNLSLFILIFSRWSGMVMIAPVFGARGVPGMVKLGLAASLSLVLFPLVLAKQPAIPNELFPYIAIIVKEILIGLALGFVMNLVTAIMQGAGQLIDFQIGFLMGNTIDPINGMQSPMTGSFLMVLTTMLLLATNAHHYIIAAMARSYDFLPINPSGITHGAAFYIEITARVIVLSLQIAMPVFGALFLADVGVGLLSKTVPQLNMFSVIFPVKIIFGIALLFLMIPFFGESVSRIFDTSMQWIFELLRGWKS
ncbi:MAG: flagellar biosynthetic protein FliR [Peptococcaceae bacterium]|nr:flagellar biosynthetic protein FliR [Peptococcaceae bacterium]